ncbi:MAG: glycine betaine ABC transporter substrate-binding protein [Pseudomonadales bacterium]
MSPRWRQWLTGVPIALAGVLALAYLIVVGEQAADRPAGRHDAMVEADEGQPAMSPQRSAGSDRPLKIGWTAWADAEIVSHLAARVIQTYYDQPVELVMADIGIQYQGVASGDLDAMLMAWLPVTHRDYWARFSRDVVDLGPIYTRARLGWAVPAYVPASDLGSIADLAKPQVRRRLHGRIHGIDPGSGLMQASERALRAYDLDGMELVSSSGAAMTAELARAIRRREWIVVTAWNPHWMFARWDLRYLTDPKGVFGARERVHAIVRRGLYQDYPPRITEFFTRLYIPMVELEAALLEATRTSADEAVSDYIASHPERIRYWVDGELDTP